MYIYNNVQYSDRTAALQAIQADENMARNELRRSRMHFVASVALTLVLSTIFASDVLGFTSSTLQTKVLTVIGLGYFLAEDNQRARWILWRENEIARFFQAARDQLGQLPAQRASG
ncbi:MAG: hypothetical protein K1X28_07045 [Parachlamydiales bacterium]|nr:hypothetical protein [Parachlamydiales bacterium]